MVLAAWLALAFGGEQYLTPQTTVFEDVATDGVSDEDHNDVVLRWSAKCDRNPSGVVRQTIHFAAVAAGASRTNQLVIVPPAASTATLTVGLGAPASLAPEIGGELVLFDDFRDAFAGPPTGFVNVYPGTPVDGLSAALVLEFAAPQPFGGACPAPAFAIVNDDGWIDADTTTGANLRPLSGTFVGDWQPPHEKTRITVAYPRFLAWVADVLDTVCDTECIAPMWFDQPAAGQILDRPDVATEAPLGAFDTCDDASPGLTCGDPDGVCPPCGVYVLAANGTRTWSDGTFAASCDGYRHPTGGQSYAGFDATSGTYTIDPVGGDPFRVYCEMDWLGGGWTKVMAYGPEGGPSMATAAAVSRNGAWTTTATGTATGKVSADEWTRLWDGTEYTIRVANPSDGKLLGNGTGYLRFKATGGTHWPAWGTGYRAQSYDLDCDRTGDAMVDQTVSHTAATADPDCGHGNFWVWDHHQSVQCFGTTSTRMKTNMHFCGTATASSDGNVTGVHSIYVRGTPATVALVGGARRWSDGAVAASCDAYRHPTPGSAYRWAGADAVSGTYLINPLNASPIQAWCDMDYDGGGWTKVMSYGPSTAQGLGTGGYNPSGAWTASARGTAVGKLSNAQWSAIWGHKRFVMRVQGPSDGKFIGNGSGYLDWSTTGTFTDFGDAQRPTNYTLGCDRTGDGVIDESRFYGSSGASDCGYGYYWLYDHFPGDQCYGNTSTYLRTNIHFCGTTAAQSDGNVTGTHHIYVRD